MSEPRTMRFAILAMVGAIALAPFAAFLRAWALSIMWDWYIVPAFGLHPLRVVYAFGMCSIATFLTYDYDEETSEDLGRAIGVAIIGPLVAVGVAWLGTFFI